MNNSYNKDFENFTKKNTSFFKNSKNYKNNILVLSITNDLIFNTILLKFAKAISEIEDSNILYVPFLKYNIFIKKLAKSFKVLPSNNIILLFSWSFIKHFFTVLSHLIKIYDGNTLETYSISNIPIGKHIYDFVLRKYRIPTLNNLKIKHRILILIGLCYYFFLRDLIIKKKIKSVVTLDNVYIEGILFELAKFFNLKMYTGFDINLLTLHVFENDFDYSKHCRTPDQLYLNKKFEDPFFISEANNFINNRFSGDQNQHDAKRAFSSKNLKLNREELKTNYNLSDGKIVLIVPHIFCDAPHGFPSVFYKDYHEWFCDTLKVLNQNKEINVIVKEHPSASLYDEDGYLEHLIKTLNLDNVILLSNRINAKSLMETVDFCVTCGGTSGMEYAYHGVPVVLASSPPYGDFKFFNKAKSRNDYHELLNNIESLRKPTDTERTTAGYLLFTRFKHYGIDKVKAKLNYFHVNLGEDSNLNYFFKNISKDDSIIHSHIVISKALKGMLDNNYKNLYKN